MTENEWSVVHEMEPTGYLRSCTLSPSLSSRNLMSSVMSSSSYFCCSRFSSCFSTLHWIMARAYSWRVSLSADFSRRFCKENNSVRDRRFRNEIFNKKKQTPTHTTWIGKQMSAYKTQRYNNQSIKWNLIKNINCLVGKKKLFIKQIVKEYLFLMAVFLSLTLL